MAKQLQLGKMVDITAPEDVEVQIRWDGKVIWINVDGSCVFRACKISKLAVYDERIEREKWLNS